MFAEQAVQFELDETKMPGRIKLVKSKSTSVRYEQFIESVKPESLEAFRASQVKRSYAKGSVLYEAGEASTGIYLIDEGRIKLSMKGRTERVHSRTARRGEMLGLCPAVSGRPHDATGQTLVRSQVSFIPKDVFVKLMYQDSEFAFCVLQLLCDDLEKAFEHNQRAAMGSAGSGSKRKVTTLVLQ